MADAGEIYRLRQAKTIELERMWAQHSVEDDVFFEDYRKLLRERGLDESEIEHEVFALIRAATPVEREYLFPSEQEPGDG